MKIPLKRQLIINSLSALFLMLALSSCFRRIEINIKLESVSYIDAHDLQLIMGHDYQKLLGTSHFGKRYILLKVKSNRNLSKLVKSYGWNLSPYLYYCKDDYMGNNNVLNYPEFYYSGKSILAYQGPPPEYYYTFLNTEEIEKNQSRRKEKLCLMIDSGSFEYLYKSNRVEFFLDH